MDGALQVLREEADVSENSRGGPADYQLITKGSW